MKLLEERILKDGYVLGENIPQGGLLFDSPSGFQIDERNWPDLCGPVQRCGYYQSRNH